jgi:hypothetical protein
LLRRLQLDERPRYFANFYHQLCQLRAETGRPHWTLIDEAHHMMPPGRETANSLPLQAHGTVFITVHPSDVAKGALETVNLIVILGGAPAATLSLFCDAVGELSPELGNRQVDAGFAYIWDRPPRRLHHARSLALGSNSSVTNGNTLRVN